jgi:hypothetical protein
VIIVGIGSYRIKVIKMEILMIIMVMEIIMLMLKYKILVINNKLVNKIYHQFNLKISNQKILKNNQIKSNK